MPNRVLKDVKDLRGNVIDSFRFDRLQIQDLAVTPDAKRFVAVAVLLETMNGTQPRGSRPEKRILGSYPYSNQRYAHR